MAAIHISVISLFFDKRGKRMKKRLLLALVSAGITGTSFAQNVDSKDCRYLRSHMMVQLGDVVVKQGEVARPMFNFRVSAYLDKDYPSDIWVDIQNDYCIDNDCRHDVWPRGLVRPLYGYQVENMGTLDIGKVMLNKGTFNSTYRLRSGALGCDVTAVGTIFVQ